MRSVRRLITGLALAAMAAIGQTAPAHDDSTRAPTLMTEGLKLLGQRTPDALHQAAADYQEAADLWRKAGNTSKQLEALLNLASAYFYLHEPGSASAFLKQALALAQASGNRAGEGKAFVGFAILHDNPGDREEAIDELAQARKIFEELGDKKNELQVVGMEGQAFEKTKDLPRAIETYESALPLMREAGSREDEALMLLRLAQLNQMLPQPEASEKAVAQFQEAVPLLQANSDRFNETVAWWGLGLLNDKLGRLEQACDAYLHALPLLAVLKNFREGGQIVLSLAIDEEKLQQTDKAIEHYEQALPLLVSAEDELDQFIDEMHLGKVCERSGQNAKALAAYQAAAAVTRAASDKSSEGAAYLHIGSMQLNAHAWNEALAAYGEAEKLFEAAGLPQSEVSALAGMGAAYASLGEYKKKLDCSMQELALVQEGKDPRAKAAALLAVGDSCNALHECGKALDFLGQALALNEQQPAGRAAVLAEMGEVHHEMGNQAEALRLQNEALDIFRSQGNPGGEAKVLNDIGLIHSALGEKTKAQEAFEKVLESARTRKDIQQEAATLNNLARLHQDFGDNKEAEKLYGESLDLVRQYGDRSQEAGTLGAMGMLYHSFGEEEEAIEKLNSSLAECRSVEDRHGEAVTLNSLSIVYRDTGETQKAMDNETLALSILRVLDDTSGVAGGLSTLGSIYRSLGLDERAESYLKQALEKQQQVGDEDGEAATLNNLAVVAQQKDEPRQALRYFEQSLPLIEKSGNRIAQARLLASMAMVLIDTGHSPTDAIEKLNRCLQIAHEAGDLDDEALALHNLGSVYSQLGDLNNALAHYHQALGLWNQIRSESSAAKALSLMAKAERKQGNLELALDHINEAIRLNESLRSRLASQEQRAYYLATVVNPYEIKIGLLMDLDREHPGRGYDAEALATCERERARSLLELLTESQIDIRQGVDSELLAQERMNERSLSAKGSELRKLNTPSQDSPKLELEIEDLTAEHEKIEAQIRIKSPGYAALTQPQPLSVRDIQQRVLDPDTVLLEYSLGEERSYLWAVTQTSVSSYELPRRSQIEADARDYSELVSHYSASREELDERAADLSEMLLGRVASQLNGKRLLVVSDGSLTEDVPFAALPVPFSSRPLIADHEVVIEPSASVMAILRRETTGRKIPPKVVAVIADPVFESDDERLHGEFGTPAPARNSVATEQDLANAGLFAAAKNAGQSLSRLRYSRAEAEGILALTTPEQSVALLDFNASKKAVESTELGNYRAVHFATHGLLDPDHPELSGLALSFYNEKSQPIDGFLRLSEIFNLRIPVPLVVLSACASGQGKLLRGEGLVGLTRGFMYAGAASQVVSLWNVDDAATTELMIRFYQRLLGSDHLSPAAALRSAQLSMMDEGKWSHPYYWAPFIVEGEWR
jgi:CHAT domain-containing protein